MRWFATNKLPAFRSERPLFCGHVSIFPTAAQGVRKVASGWWGKLVLKPIRLKSERRIAGARLCKASSRVAAFSTAHILLPYVIAPPCGFRCINNQHLKSLNVVCHVAQSGNCNEADNAGVCFPGFLKAKRCQANFAYKISFVLWRVCHSNGPLVSSALFAILLLFHEKH